ncbi:hypothetical protein IIA79_06830, partial [bacterium]|nr:hypothetical protein [bacterium]
MAGFYRLIWLSIYCGFLLQSWALPTQARTGGDPGIMLPAGERVIDMAWADSANLTVLVESVNGHALRRLDLRRGELSVIAAPKSFRRLASQGGGRRQLEFSLSPAGNAIAVLEVAGDPLKPNQLSVYSLGPGGVQSVGTGRIPKDFWVEHLAWESSGRELYMSARPYLFPEQPYSLGRLVLLTASFDPLALKANIDLISEIAYIPQRDAVAVICSSYHSEYPREPLAVLLDPKGSGMQILHTQAAGFSLYPRADGRLLLGAPPGTGNAEGREEQWVLGAEDSAMRPARLALLDSASTLAISSDGAWLGFLLGAKELGLAGRAEGRYLVLQRTADGKTLVTSLASERFAFSPTGQYVCAVGQGGDA